MRDRHWGTATLLLVGLAMVAFDSGIGAQSSPGLGGWRIAGRDLDNSRSQPSEREIGTTNVHQLVPKWVFTTGSDVSATPTVAGNSVYFPDWAGNLYAIGANDGRFLWSHSISDYNNVLGSVSRVSPVIHGDDLIIGDIESATKPHNGASIMAINRKTGMRAGPGDGGKTILEAFKPGTAPPDNYSVAGVADTDGRSLDTAPDPDNIMRPGTGRLY